MIAERAPLDSCAVSLPCYSYAVDHSRRIGLLRRRMTKAGLAGLLVTHLPDLRYLSGFTGSSAALAVTRRAARLFTDGRYTAQAAEEVKAAQVQIVASSPAVAAVEWLAAQIGVTSAGFDATHVTVAELARWKQALPLKLKKAFLAELAAPLVEPLRNLKDQDELALMSKAALPVLHHRSSSLFSIPIFRLFRLRMYNGKMKPFGYGWPMWTSIAMWCVIEIYWDMAKKNIAPETDSESRRSRWLHLLLLSAAQFLIFLPIHGLRQRYLPASAIVAAAGLTVNAFGLVLAIWSRRCLGRYWSGKITIKVDHQLIRSGPYRLIRHPIYTALLGLYLGTAIVSGELHALIGWVLAVVAYLRKIRLEEANLAKAFGEEYRSYRR